MKDIFLTTPSQINTFRIYALRACLKLEVLGMKKHHGPTAYSIVKKEFGFKGSKERVLEQLNAHISKGEN